MAFVDYWSLLCPVAIEKGFNVALSPNMAENPDHLTLYRDEADPVVFQPAFNCPEDIGEPGPHIAVRVLDKSKQSKDYLKFTLNQVEVEKGAEKTWVETVHAFKAYIWKPMAYNPATANWDSIPRSYTDEWLNWQLHYLSALKGQFFHERY